MMGRGWDYGYDMMNTGSWIGMLLTALFAALIIAGLIVLVVWAVRSSNGHRYATHGGYGGPGHRGYEQERDRGSGFDFLGPQSGRADDAVEIARRRFAAGEITREQYDEILNALNR